MSKIHKELRENDLVEILSAIRKYKVDHPKARVVYDVERDGVFIYYPLPRDYGKLQKFKINNLL